MDWLKQCFGVDWRTDLLIVAMFVSFIFWIRLLWKVQRGLNGIDFTDWLRGPDGKASWKQASGIAGFMVGTFCIIYTTLVGRVPEGYVLLFLVYFAICIGNPLAASMVSMVRGVTQRDDPPNKQIKVDAPADATVNVQTGPQNQPGET